MSYDIKKDIANKFPEIAEKLNELSVENYAVEVAAIILNDNGFRAMRGYIANELKLSVDVGFTIELEKALAHVLPNFISTFM